MQKQKKHAPKLSSLNPLKAGDLIRVVASASPFDKQAFLEGVDVLSSWGFQVAYQDDIFSRSPYLAGNDHRRADELINALKDKECKAILFARGGYGSMRLLPQLEQARLSISPKIILGYSDITSILMYFLHRFDWPVFYGPVVAKDLSGETAKQTLTSLRSTLQGSPSHSHSLKTCKILRHGKTKGKLMGGCLTLVTHLLGTEYMPNLKQSILFLEDTNEKPYQIDRMLTHLKLCGIFDSCQGVIIGSMNGPNPAKHYTQTIMDVLAPYKFPVVYGFAAGHSKIKTTLPLGTQVLLDTQNKTLSLIGSLFDL